MVEAGFRPAGSLIRQSNDHVESVIQYVSRRLGVTRRASLGVDATSCCWKTHCRAHDEGWMKKKAEGDNRSTWQRRLHMKTNRGIAGHSSFLGVA